MRPISFVALALLTVGCGSGEVTGSGVGGAGSGAVPNGTGRGSCTVSADCDDGNYCNGVESCTDGFCRHGTAIDCDDEVDCTRDDCDENANRCQNTPDHASCGDGASCDRDDGCVDATTCTGDSDCDDQIFCNGIELCGPDGLCTEGQPVTCDDGNDCTEDACSEEDHVCTNLLRDADRDGHGDASCRGGTDCDDDDPGINPGAREICGDGVDNDCDRDRDCDDSLCAERAECGGDRNADDRNRDDRDRDDGDRNGDRNRDRDRDRDGRDPCAENRWYDDGECDDVCLRRDPDCDRDRDRNRRDREGRRDDRGGRDDRRNGGARRNRVDERDERGACGRTPHNGRCVDRKTVELCTGEGRREEIERRTCPADQECVEQRGERADCRPVGGGSAPRGWNTNLCPAEWATDAGCDCGCGAADPRCNGNGCTGPGCTSGSACAYCWAGTSTTNRTNACPGGVSSSGGTRLPSGWNTNLCPAEWATDDGCDCGCGGVDPACNGNGCTGAGCTTGSACQYCWAGTGTADRHNACPDGVTPNRQSLPSGWNTDRCPASWASDSGCDCGCGGADPTCDGEGCTGEGCTSGEACEYCWAGTGEGRHDVCAGGANGSNGGLPSGWNTDRCPANWASDGGCDCGCGGADPTCDGEGCSGEGCTDGDACEYCWAGTGASRRNACEGGVDSEDDDMPTGWNTQRCDAGWASDSECDCGCGGEDPACDGDGCTGDGCTTGSACEYCWSGTGQSVINECPGGVDGAGAQTEDDGDLPAGWNTDRCPASWASDTGCDCGCGGEDPACDGDGCTSAGCRTGSACEYCWSGSGGNVVNECEGGVDATGDDPDSTDCNEDSWYKPCSGPCAAPNYDWENYCVDGDGYPDAGDDCCVNDTDGSVDDQDPADGGSCDGCDCDNYCDTDQTTCEAGCACDPDCDDEPAGDYTCDGCDCDDYCDTGAETCQAGCACDIDCDQAEDPDPSCSCDVSWGCDDCWCEPASECEDSCDCDVSYDCDAGCSSCDPDCYSEA